MIKTFKFEYAITYTPNTTNSKKFTKKDIENKVEQTLLRILKTHDKNAKIIGKWCGEKLCNTYSNANNIFPIFANRNNRGALLSRAENTPSEPDPDNAGVGKEIQPIIRLSSIDLKH